MILTKFKKKDYYHLADKGMIIWYEEIRELWIIDVSEKKNDFFLSTRGFKQANVILFRFTRDIIPPVPLLINVTTINAHILSLSLSSFHEWCKYSRRGYTYFYITYFHRFFAANFHVFALFRYSLSPLISKRLIKRDKVNRPIQIFVTDFSFSSLFFSSPISPR